MKQPKQSQDFPEASTANLTSDPVSAVGDDASSSSTEPRNNSDPRLSGVTGQAIGSTGASDYPVGDEKPNVDTPYKEAYERYRRKHASSRRDFFDEVFHELNKIIDVNGRNGKSRMRGSTFGAKNSARALMKGNLKDWAHVIEIEKLIEKARRTSPDAANSDLDEKQPKIIGQIMHDFMVDINEEQYQRYCDLVGEQNVSNKKLLGHTILQYYDEYSKQNGNASFSDTVFFKLLAPYTADERRFLAKCPKRRNRKRLTEQWERMNGRDPDKRRRRPRRSLK